MQQDRPESRAFERILLMRPLSGLLPLLMSGAAILLVLLHAAIFGIVPERDEGATAHLFQLLMALQLPAMAYFAWRYVRPRPSLYSMTIALQVVLAGIALLIAGLLT